MSGSQVPVSEFLGKGHMCPAKVHSPLWDYGQKWGHAVI